jgi:hypothetical protein
MAQSAQSEHAPFLLYKRGQIWFALIFSPTTKEYRPGKPTGERRAAEHVADDWLHGLRPGGRV